MYIEDIIISFAFFSFIGWAYESFGCSMVIEEKFMNKGFLISPVCPVYGIGAIACYSAFSSIDNIPVLFITSAIMSSIIEYITGYLLEKIFHGKWWDYSEYPFQIHGRICLYGAFLFGVCNVLICKFVEPLLLDCLSYINVQQKEVIAIGITVVLLFDIIITTIGQKSRLKNISTAYGHIIDVTNSGMQRISLIMMRFVPASITNKKAKIQNRARCLNEYLKEKEGTFLSYLW